MALTGLPQIQVADMVAGFSVALILIPQSLAYAQIAGMPVVAGLFASALPLIASAPFGSSPYLQTGPVALTSLLTFAALHGAGYATTDANYVAMAGVLALIVGALRLLLGIVRAGWVAYLICEPVMVGFTSAAALIILSSQLPKALGAAGSVPAGNTLRQATWALTHPSSWHPTAAAFAAVTILLMLGGRRLHRLFPGVMVAVIIGLIGSRLLNDPGSLVGHPVPIPEGLPHLGFDVPLDRVPSLAFGGLAIALVGYAEPASIARIFAAEDKVPWDSNRELIGQGIANIAAAFSGAFPVGGSFSRSAVNRLAGARTRWSGGVTGLVVLCFLPFAGVLNPLPEAVLGGIVIGAVVSLIKPAKVLGMWRLGWFHALLCWATFALTLLTLPDVHWAVILGVVLTAVVQMIAPLRLELGSGGEGPAIGDDATVTVVPTGLLWVGTYGAFASQLQKIADDHPEANLQVDFGEAGSPDPAVVKSLATSGAVAVAGDNPR